MFDDDTEVMEAVKRLIQKSLSYEFNMPEYFRRKTIILNLTQINFTWRYNQQGDQIECKNIELKTALDRQELLDTIADQTEMLQYENNKLRYL